MPFILPHFISVVLRLDLETVAIIVTATTMKFAMAAMVIITVAVGVMVILIMIIAVATELIVTIMGKVGEATRTVGQCQPIQYSCQFIFVVASIVN